MLENLQQTEFVALEFIKQWEHKDGQTESQLTGHSQYIGWWGM